MEKYSCKIIIKTIFTVEGEILIDNYPINQIDLYSLRKQIGLIPQESVLFEGTIRDNIAISKPDADFDEISEVTKIACADEFIKSFPLGYNTLVGESKNIRRTKTRGATRTLLTNLRY